jgi:CDP-glucose 4,6-dehydratase
MSIEMFPVSSNFWYGKRVLVTGADGFVASHLMRKLMQLGAVVTAVTRHKRPITTLKLLDVDELPDIEHSDLSDFAQTQEICHRHSIDTIFHLAASAVVSAAANAPISTVQNNVLPTLNLLETARINRIPRVLVASSDKSYGDHAEPGDAEPVPYRENYALRGLDVYSASKVCADMISHTYAFQFKLPVLVTRACNIYGPADLNFSRLIPRTILRLLSGQPPVINAGNHTVLREYIYVEDMVDAYLFLGKNIGTHYKSAMPEKGRTPYGWAAYNIGSYGAADALVDSPNIKSVIEVIELVGSKLGTGLRAAVIPKPANFIEIPDQYLDSSKLHKLGFRPRIALEEGVERTILWYKEHQDLLMKLARRYLEPIQEVRVQAQ